jgi:hypothetical protein
MEEQKYTMGERDGAEQPMSMTSMQTQTQTKHESNYRQFFREVLTCWTASFVELFCERLVSC